MVFIVINLTLGFASCELVFALVMLTAYLACTPFKLGNAHITKLSLVKFSLSNSEQGARLNKGFVFFFPQVFHVNIQF
jgi:hypothetical protein